MPGQGTQQLERQIREQVESDRAGQPKPEIERKPGLSQQQQDEQREREQDVREQREKPNDGGTRQDKGPPPP